MVSQEYFDEVCLENADLFDLGEDEALAETIAQLSKTTTANNPGQQPGQQGDGDDEEEDWRLDVTCTFPTSPHGLRERSDRRAFRRALERLEVEAATASTATTTTERRSSDDEEGNDDDDEVDDLNSIQRTIGESFPTYARLFARHGGFATYLKLLGRNCGNDNNDDDHDRGHEEEEEEAKTAPLTIRRTILDTLVLLLEGPPPPASPASTTVTTAATGSSTTTCPSTTWRRLDRLRILANYQAAMAAAPTTPDPSAWWLPPYRAALASDGGATDFGTLELLLALSCGACQQNEAQKQRWMKLKQQQQQSPSSASSNSNSNSNNEEMTMPQLLVDTMDACLNTDDESSEDNDKNISRMIAVRRLGRFITLLCTYEPDLVVDQNDASPTMSSAHANVLQLAERNAVPGLLRLLQAYPEQQPDTLLALRAMAIQDQVVQNMVKCGLLDRVREILLRTANGIDEADKAEEHDDGNNNNEAMAAACAGLIRNLCANDSIKGTLCVGSKGIVPLLLQAMTAYPDNATVQEHGCGTLAAMALRQPKNATYLVVDQCCHERILWAMRRHPDRAALQRQAALAVRNLASRSPELRSVLKESGVVQALVEIAAAHGDCQDEVYAALRDLDVHGVSLRHVVNVVPRQQQPGDSQQQQQQHQHQQGAGYVVETQKTQVFGERNNSNFRAEYD